MRRQVGNYFAAGLHWPSVLTEDLQSVLNYAEALTYFTMRERADGVGQVQSRRKEGTAYAVR